MRRLALTLIALTLALALVAGAAAAVHRGSLKITYWPQGVDGPTTTWTLRYRDQRHASRATPRVQRAREARSRPHRPGPAVRAPAEPALAAGQGDGHVGRTARQSHVPQRLPRLERPQGAPDRQSLLTF